MSEWTLVTGTPPPVGVNVLGWDAEHRMSDEVRIVWLRDGDTASDPWRIDDDSGTASMHVTHWMPLPEPPTLKATPSQRSDSRSR